MTNVPNSPNTSTEYSWPHPLRTTNRGIGENPVHRIKTQIANGVKKISDRKLNTYSSGVTGDLFTIQIKSTSLGEYLKLSHIAPVDFEGSAKHVNGSKVRTVDSVSFVSPRGGQQLIFVGASHHLQSGGFVGLVDDKERFFKAVYKNGETFARLIEGHAKEFLRQIADLNEADLEVQDLDRAISVGRLLLDARDVLEDPHTSFGTDDELTARLGAVHPWDEKCTLELLVNRYEHQLAARMRSGSIIQAKGESDIRFGPAFD